MTLLSFSIDRILQSTAANTSSSSSGSEPQHQQPLHQPGPSADLYNSAAVPSAVRPCNCSAFCSVPSSDGDHRRPSFSMSSPSVPTAATTGIAPPNVIVSGCGMNGMPLFVMSSPWQDDAFLRPPWIPQDCVKNVLAKLQQRRIGHPYQTRAPPKHKKARTSFSKYQIAELERTFIDQKYLASAERAALAQNLRMSDAQVKTWFQNRRTKWRRQSAEEKEQENSSSYKCLNTSSYSFSTDMSGSPYFARPDVTI